MAKSDTLTLLIGLLDTAGALCVLAGMVMLLRNARRHFRNANKLTWLHADLNQPHFIERQLYRHHRLVGTLLIAAAAFWLWLLSSLGPWRAWLKLTWHYLRQLFTSGVLMWLGAYAVALSILVFGIVLALRPSMLKSLESTLNRWISHKNTKPDPTNCQEPNQPSSQSVWRFSALALIFVGCLLLGLAILLHQR